MNTYVQHLQVSSMLCKASVIYDTIMIINRTFATLHSKIIKYIGFARQHSTHEIIFPLLLLLAAESFQRRI